MINNDLEHRIQTFANMALNFKHKKVVDLICAHNIKARKFFELQDSILKYLGKSANNYFDDASDMLGYYIDHYDNIPCITPNGLVAPKNNTVLEYNLICQNFYDIISNLNINHLIHSWHVPLNIRIKLGTAIGSNLTREYPTEYIHSDSWAGESSHSVTTMIPVFGDTYRNYVEYYEPPSNFKEEWLGPRPSYKDGDDVVQKYSKINYIAPIGTLNLVDFATLHRSHRESIAGVRVSIDTTFLLKRNETQAVEHPWRTNERASPEIVHNLGKDYLFYFPDDPATIASNLGGFKHPTNLQIRKLI